MNKTEEIEDQGSRQEFEDLLRRAEVEWLAILKETSAQLTKSSSQDLPFEK
jgi:hypothetical protein